MMSRVIPRCLFFWALCCVMLCASAGKAWSAELASGAADAKNVTRLACVGDSITAGAGVSDRETKSYPARLGQWLGAGWNVGNFGASGSTLLRKGNLPYWDRPQFKKALAFKPDVVIIMLGTNDSKHGSPDNPKVADNWQYKADFAGDYKALLAEFRNANPNIKIFLGLPVPAFAPNSFGIDGAVVEKEIVPLVREVAAQSGAATIDLHSVLQERTLFKDRVHPNDAGARLLAATVYRALTGGEPPSDAEPSAATGAAPANSSAPAASSAPPTSSGPATAAATTTQPASAVAATPARVVVTPPEKESFHVYLLMGQSNMAGRGDLRESGSQGDNPRVLALNPDNQWVVARDPLHPKVGRTEPGVGPGMSFALGMLKADPKITIGLIPCAVGGSSLRSWVKGADYYENAVSRAKIAAQAGVIKGVLWHQGEADTASERSASTYETRLTKMLGDVRADLGLPNLPVVVGQLGDFLTTEKYPYVETVRAAIKHIPAAVPDVGYADSAGLGHKGDNLHFNAAAQKELGARFAKAMRELQRQK